MGDLKHFDLNQFIQKHNVVDMIETGTYKGDAVAYALHFNLKNIYSVELIKEFYEHSSKRFENNKNVRIINSTSKEGLIQIFNNHSVGNCLFWLDAHLPNFYQKQYGDDYKKDKDLLIPLEEEIKIIIANKDVSNDVFIIDDLRIYETGSFQKGNWNGAIVAGVGGIDFIYKLLDQTHDIKKLYDDEGYILCTPKLK